MTDIAAREAGLRRNAEQFLARWNLSLADLVDFAPAVGPGDCLLLCSTIPEGLANELSDIDLIYIGENVLKGKVRMRLDAAHDLDVSHNDQGREVNVARLSRPLLEQMTRTLADSIEAVETARIKPDAIFEHDAQRLILAHRMRNAVPLAGPEVYAEWYRRLHLDKLHIHLCLYNVEHYLNRRENVEGEIAAGNIESAAWVAKTIMAPKLAAGLLAAIGVTNTAQKWHLRLLRRHQADLGEDIVDTLIRFILSTPPANGDRLVEDIWHACEPALRRIYELQRQVHRAAYKFGCAVRYERLRKTSGMKTAEGARA